MNKEISNNELLAELAKNNNIELKNNFNFSKEKPTLTKSNVLKFISYGDVEPKDMKGLLGKINMENTSLIVHVGDTQLSKSPCTESLNLLQYRLINSLNAPVLYTPGDNEWLDCQKKNKGNSYNLERLDFIRKTYFSNNLTLGKNPLIVENQNQNGFPEKARLMKNNVVFITVHIVGGNNNFDPFSKKKTLEYLKRDAANIDWITKSFEKYKEASAFVVIMHANIFSSKNIPWLHEKFANSLVELSNKYERPVLVLNGNIHEFKAFQPMTNKYPFLHVIENFGDPNVKAIEIEVNDDGKIPFNVTKIIG